MRARPGLRQITRRRFTPALSGAFVAAAIGLGAGAALKPTPAECGLPRPPQLLHLSQAELVALERSPQTHWPSVPASWRNQV